MKIVSLEQEILAAADHYVQEGIIPFLPMNGYENYLRQGDRLQFEAVYFERRRQLAVLGLAYHVKRDDTVRVLLEQVIWEICNEYSWALPAHLPIIGEDFGTASPVWLDLFAAETGQALAEMLELFGESLTSMTRQRMMQEIQRRIFDPFEEHMWEWEYKENNWSSVIAGCIGMTALAALPLHSPQQKRLVERLDTAMQSYLRGFGDDGACVEGVGYWSYGFGYFIYYAEKLAAVWGDTRYLQLEKVKHIAAFPYYASINQQDYIPFSDYSHIELPSGLVSFCHEYFHVKTPQLSGTSTLDFDHCYRFAQLYRNLIWHSDAIKKEQTEAVWHYFPDAQWLVVKNPAAALFFAAKGGTNEESHNHIDIGHFVFGDMQELFLTDLGAGEYTRDYFREDSRYNYFPNAAASHSIPIVNGQMQIPGQVAADKTEVEETGGEVRFSLSLAQTYASEAAVTALVRQFATAIDGQQLQLRDQFAFAQTNNHVIEQLISKYPPVVTGNQVVLHSPKYEKRCTIIFTTTKIRVEEVSYRNHQGATETAYVIQAAYDFSTTGEAIITMTMA